MIIHRPSAERGHFNFGWLDTRHTFSFGDYHDPKWMSFGPLRVINEDVVAPGAGFPMHAHHDMEIITYVLAGALEHQDSLGNRGVIRPGELQRMSAGRGIRHSEFNASRDEPVHLLQIWIEPRERGSEPGYDQRRIDGPSSQLGSGDTGGLRLIASPDGRAGTMPIRQDATIRAGALPAGGAGGAARLPIAPGRLAWVQVARGSVTLNGVPLVAGDGAGARDEPVLDVWATERAEVLVFDLPASAD